MNPQASADPGAQAQRPSNNRDDRDEGAPPLAEWIAAAIGLLLVLGCAGILAWHALRGEDGPPDPVLQVEHIEAMSSGGFLVRLQVRNAGSQAATDLHIAGELRGAGADVERSQARIDHLPAGASREAGLYFTRDPRLGELALRAQGYQAP